MQKASLNLSVHFMYAHIGKKAANSEKKIMFYLFKMALTGSRDKWRQL